MLLALYIPLAVSPGSSSDGGFSGEVGDENMQQQYQRAGVAGGTAGGGGRRRWGFGGADGGAGGGEGGDGDRGSVRRVTSVDDAKPLLVSTVCLFPVALRVEYCIVIGALLEW